MESDDNELWQLSMKWAIDQEDTRNFERVSVLMPANNHDLLRTVKPTGGFIAIHAHDVISERVSIHSENSCGHVKNINASRAVDVLTAHCMQFFTLVLLCALALPGTASETVPYGHSDFYPSASHPAGLQGDGSGRFPAATPVTEWDWSTGKNIVWATPLPSFGFSSPIVVGDKIFVTAEFNLLVCLNARDGKILWTADLDTIPIVAKGDEEAVRVKWNKLWKYHSEGYAAVWEYCYWCYKRDVVMAAQAGKSFAFPGKGRGGYAGPIYDKKKTYDWFPGGCLSKEDLVQVLSRHKDVSDGELATINARIKELDTLIRERQYAPRTNAYGPVGDPHLRGSPQVEAYKKEFSPLIKELREQYQLTLEMWNGWMNAFPTPISDGEHVFVQMQHGQVACYDLEGNRRWMKVFVDEPEVSSGALAQNNSVSPILADDKLVVSFGGGRNTHMTIRCFDKVTGDQLWKHRDLKLESNHSFNQIRRVHTETVDVIVSGSCLMLDTNSGDVISDFRPITFHVAPPLVDGDTVTFIRGGGQCGGGGMYACRLVANDGEVTPQWLWAVIPKGTKKSTDPAWASFAKLLPEDKLIDVGTLGLAANRPSSQVSGVLHSGSWLFPHWQFKVDAATGVVTTLSKNRFKSSGHIILAGEYLIASGQNGQMTVFPVASPDKPIAMRNQVGSMVHRQVQLGDLGHEDVLKMIRTHHYDPKTKLMLQSTPWAQGNRLYVRTRDSVFCIGDPAKPYHSPATAPTEARTQ